MNGLRWWMFMKTNGSMPAQALNVYRQRKTDAMREKRKTRPHNNKRQL